jgi:hypothetical protein
MPSVALAPWSRIMVFKKYAKMHKTGQQKISCVTWVKTGRFSSPCQVYSWILTERFSPLSGVQRMAGVEQRSSQQKFNAFN